ncbi:unnamed protein product [Phytophthora fragariaefolia]|uniref:Unnamed protein product n=1 Tax=Phytophthora fragariaefolia TaxID=1490495 RepID=A0A9W7DB75_9STRA|nr:unnamed protein product [Phytophthora fragariaefolia]
MTSGNNSKNPGMSSIIRKMNKVIFEVKHVEVTGDLFKELCESMTTGKSTTLLSYSDARFLRVTKAMRRVLDKWQAIEAWYDERASKATRENSTPPVFPLAGEFTTLTQLMSILQSLADFKRSCQAEMPTQVENLMILYSIRLNDLDLEKPIRHYLSTRKKPIWIQPSDLTPIASTTRRLLQEALDKRFFIRYYDETKMATTSYVFETQQKLHPVFKSPRHNLNAVILKVCQSHGDSGRVACEKRDKVHQRIRDQLRSLIERVSEPRDMRDTMPSSTPAYCGVAPHRFFGRVY